MVGLSQKLTHRQFLTYHEWLKDQWDRPSRTDYYLMQLTAIVKSAASGKSVTLDQCKLPPFDHNPPNPAKDQKREQAINASFEQRTKEALGVTW